MTLQRTVVTEGKNKSQWTEGWEIIKLSNVNKWFFLKRIKVQDELIKMYVLSKGRSDQRGKVEKGSPKEKDRINKRV